MLERHQGDSSPWISRIWLRNEREAIPTGLKSLAASGDSSELIGTVWMVLEPFSARSCSSRKWQSYLIGLPATTKSRCGQAVDG